MLALVLSQHPLSVKQYLPDRIVQSETINEDVVPMAVSTYEQLLSALKDYNPKIIVIFSEMVGQIAYDWIQEAMLLMNHGQKLFILPKSEMDEYHLRMVLEDIWKKSPGQSSSVFILGTNLLNSEIAALIAGTEQGNTVKQKEIANNGHVVTLLGPGSSGVTTFALYYVPYLAELYPQLSFLLVDMNENKRDLAVATNSQNYRLSYYTAQLQTDKPFEITYHTPYKKLPNLFSFSAVQDHVPWSANQICRFLQVIRQNFDVIFIDRGEAELRTAEMNRLMTDSDENIYLVRADGLSLGRTKRYTKQLQQHQAQVIVSRFQPEFVSLKELEQVLDLPVKGYFPYQRELIPIDGVTERLVPSKKVVSAFAAYRWNAESLAPEKVVRLRKVSFFQRFSKKIE